MSKQRVPCRGEQSIIKGLKAGDGEAVERFYEMFASRLYRYIYYQVDGAKEDAEDLLQETFIASLHSIEKFRGDSCLYTWLCSIARHKIQDFYRKGLRQVATLEIDDHNEEDPVVPANVVAWKALYKDFQEHEQSIAIQEMVEEALLKLPETYREVLVLRYVEELSVTEISQITNRTYKATESLLSRARTAFKDTFEKVKEEML